MLAYGVASQALRYPNQQLDWALLKNVIYQPYWNIYGELFLEDIEGIYIIYVLLLNLNIL